MTRNAQRAAMILAALAVVAATFALTRHPSEKPSRQQVSISGNYSDDWMKMCGQVEGAAQETCTSVLNEAYGRADGKPVPAEGKDGPAGARTR